MLYNLHGSKTGPGPLATKAWIAQVLSYAAGRCDRLRIVPVLKLGAMDWGPDGFKELQYADLAERLATTPAESIERHPDGGSPHFRYEAPGGAHTVYYEDAASILEKVAFIQELGFDAVVLWSLGREDPQILPGLSARKSYQTRISSAALTPQPE
jgi:spore germination protein YaaH